MSKLIRFETCDADEIYFSHGYIELYGSSDYSDGRVFISLGKRVDGDFIAQPDEEGAMRLANLFLAAEDLLDICKYVVKRVEHREFRSRQAYAAMKAAIARAEGKTVENPS